VKCFTGISGGAPVMGMGGMGGGMQPGMGSMPSSMSSVLSSALGGNMTSPMANRMSPGNKESSSSKMGQVGGVLRGAHVPP